MAINASVVGNEGLCAISEWLFSWCCILLDFKSYRWYNLRLCAQYGTYQQAFRQLQMQFPIRICIY